MRRVEGSFASGPLGRYVDVTTGAQAPPVKTREREFQKTDETSKTDETTVAANSVCGIQGTHTPVHCPAYLLALLRFFSAVPMFRGGLHVPPPPPRASQESTVSKVGWKYPNTLAEEKSTAVFEDLWERGLCVAGGSKYGADYVVYDGKTPRG